MTLVRCTLGADRADALLNRPVLVLRAEEVAELLAPDIAPAAPRLRGLLDAQDTVTQVVGVGGLPALRAELFGLLDSLAAARLPERIALALALQRLDTACATAQEFGLNLYVAVTIERD